MFGFNKRSKIKLEESEKKFKDQLKQEPLEKGDIPALIIAGLIIAVPVILIVVGIVLLSAWLVFGR